jgi:hypothetical protein
METQRGELTRSDKATNKNITESSATSGGRRPQFEKPYKTLFHILA